MKNTSRFIFFKRLKTEEKERTRSLVNGNTQFRFLAFFLFLSLSSRPPLTCFSSFQRGLRQSKKRHLLSFQLSFFPCKSEHNCFLSPFALFLTDSFISRIKSIFIIIASRCKIYNIIMLNFYNSFKFYEKFLFIQIFSIFLFHNRIISEQ